MTNLFSAFKFDQSNTVYFQCQAALCYDSDLRCLGSHCSLSVRRKRDAAPENVEIVGAVVVVVDNLNATCGADCVLNRAALEDELVRRNTTVVAGPSQAGSCSDWGLSAIIAVAVMAVVTAIATLVTTFFIFERRQNKQNCDH
ncbi:uncharacterized protein LOC131956879 [Physella acuta]|uniref:uncharacterized protein LOC131956879 n=1 Tax=Physella acuta TaxID=109671 RepID=UPI0027DD7038|nr:uncharacterized protein LOC131956879 [Physella acuta]